MSVVVLQMHPDDEVDCDQGTISLYPRPEAYQVWARIIWGDELVLFSILPQLSVHVAAVIGKNLINTSDLPMQNRQRLIIETGLLRVARAKVFDLGLLGSFRSGEVISPKELANINSYLSFLEFSPEKACDKDLLFPYRISQTATIGLAEDRDSVKFISRVAKQHPFGESKGAVKLVLRENGCLVGAAVVKLAYESHGHHHEGERRAFGRDSVILRKTSIYVARLHSLGRGHVRQRHYEWLLRAISYMAPNIYLDPISYISGSSYDFIPAAVSAGFSVDLPRRQYGSLFYWKPVFANLARPTATWMDLKHAYRKLRTQRQGNSWLISADLKRLEFASRHSKWAVADSPHNRGRWRSARPGDVLFFCTPSHSVIGAARIASTERMSIRGYERYPLGFHLSGVATLRREMGLRSLFSYEWLSALRIGGLIELPAEGHYALMEEFENVRAGGRMWVRPNPYLLRRTQFAVAPKRAFIVQAWDLRESIYPIIKRICEEAGWTVSHSSDREGQAIFDDIWALLNECEAVVVDFTKRRPNVYLEYGMALVLGKPVIAITQDESDLPSDTPNLKFKKYRGDANAYMDLRDKLPRALIDTIEDVQRANEQYDKEAAF